MRVRELNPALEARQFTIDNVKEIVEWLESFERYMNRVEVHLTRRKNEDELRPEIKVYLPTRDRFTNEMWIHEDDWIVIGDHTTGQKIRLMDEKHLHELYEKDEAS